MTHAGLRAEPLAIATVPLEGCGRQPRLLLEVLRSARSGMLRVASNSLLAVEPMGRGLTLLEAAKGETRAVATPDSAHAYLARGLGPFATLPGGGTALAMSAEGAWLARSHDANGGVAALPLAKDGR